MGRRLRKEGELSFPPSPTKGELSSRLVVFITEIKQPLTGLLNFGGARYLNLYEPLCGVVEYVIVNPTWRPDFDLVESKLNPELQDFIY